MKKPKLPSTDSIRELAAFWDAHDLTDFQDELEEVSEPVFVRGISTEVHLEREALATRVDLSEDTLSVALADGRTITAPLAWYPRLAHATAKERRDWRLIDGGRGIHWAAVDEDISVANLLAGQPSAESRSSFRKWLAGRPKPGRGRKRSGV